MLNKKMLRLLVAIAALCAAGAALAQSYPTRPIRFIVSQGPGGPSDSYARLIAKHLADRVGQPVVVDNRPGADGIIGMEAAAKAAPDGYTIALTASSVSAVTPNLYKKVPYDPVRDYEPITLVGSIYYVVMAKPSLPASSLAEFIALAKSKPGQYNYGHGGSLARIGTELIKAGAGVQLTDVPYKSTSASLNDLLAGQIDLVILPLSDALPHFKAGKLKALAVTSPTRIAQFPNVPTVAESGIPGFEFSAWVSVHAPAGVPKDIVRKLNTEITGILATPEIVQQFRGMGFEPQGSSPEQLESLVKSDLARFARVVKEAGITQQ